MLRVRVTQEFGKCVEEAVGTITRGFSAATDEKYAKPTVGAAGIRARVLNRYLLNTQIGAAYSNGK